jgi:L-lactate dehydrogenase
MIDVTVIGFGSVGSALSLLLLNNKNNMRVNILEPDQNKEGAILDLSHGMPLYPGKELYVNNYDMFANADFIYFTAGTPNLHGGSRLSTAKQNIQLTKDLFDDQEFNKVPYIIVITNPVDIISFHVMKFSKLPFDHVVGIGTFLDSVRLSYYLSVLSDYKADEINAYVLGEHGDSQFAAYSMTKVQGSPITELAFFSPERLEEAQNLTRNAAFQIRETQGGTLYGVSKCAETILNSLMSPEVSHYPLSILTNEHYNKMLNLDRSVYISVPIQISNKGIRIDNEVHLEGAELKLYQKSAKIISEITLD